MSILGVALDLEGTVVDVEDAHHRGHLAVAKELGIVLTLSEAIDRVPGFVGGGDEAVARGLREIAGTDAPAEWILTRLKENYFRLLSSLAIGPRPGFCARLEEMRGRGLPIAIGSLTPRVEAEFLIERAGLSDLFSGVKRVYREDVSHVKPDPEVFLRTAESLGLDPRNQLVFEDSPPGVESAIAAGSFVVAIPAVESTSVSTALKIAGADLIVSSWIEVDLQRVLGGPFLAQARQLRHGV